MPIAAEKEQHLQGGIFLYYLPSPDAQHIIANMTNLYTILREKSMTLVDAIKNMPESNIWIHEKALYNVLGITSGDTYGRRDVLTYLLKGVKNGYFGSGKDRIKLGEFGHAISDLSDETQSNEYNIRYQQNGVKEEFDTGLLGNDVSARPRWFCKGTPLVDVKTQNKIVNALTGDDGELDDRSRLRRQNNYKKFVTDDSSDDNGYVKNDVMSIIKDYEHVLKIRHIKNSQRYNVNDLKRVKDVLRLMIVASNKGGKLEESNGSLVPSKSLRPARGGNSTPATKATAAVTPSTQKSTETTYYTPTAIPFTPARNNPIGAVKLDSIRCTNDTGLPELASLELLFYLYSTNLKLNMEREDAAALAANQMEALKVKPPNTLDCSNLSTLTPQQVVASTANIKRARSEFVTSLQGLFAPNDEKMLYEWIAEGKSYTSGCSVQTPNNFEPGYNNRPSLTLSAAWILRHIIYTHHLPMRKALSLWAEFHVLIMRRPINPNWYVSERTLWNHVYRISFIDNALLTRDFANSIQRRTKHGFMCVIYISSDDSKHNGLNRHICLVSMDFDNNVDDPQPGFRHITSCVNEAKSTNANINSTNIIQTLGLRNAMHVGGGCNDNAPDAQVEILRTCDGIWDEGAKHESEEVRLLVYENGVRRKPIQFGDPYHIANLAVMHASLAAFGATEKADHTQVHHRQLLQSIHSLNSDDKAFSQEIMNRVMDYPNSGNFLRVSSKNERQQRWLVNQRNSKKTHGMHTTPSSSSNSALIEWALKFANESRSPWKKRVGKEIAIWLSMPSIILGLHFESELGNYFEVIYAWHCRTGPLHNRSGFRMLEIFDLYFGYEVPWWNDAVIHPEKKLPNTMKYLRENFEGQDLEFRKSQIMRGLVKGRDEMISMSSRYLLRPPIMFLLMTHQEHGGAFLRALLLILRENPIEEVELIHDPDSSEWGILRDASTCPWYDILCNHTEDVVHFWRQFRLNSEHIVEELKKLSKQVEPIPLHEDTAPILAFRNKYPILFECLGAIFRRMPSNSRLCEQMHGSKRHGLSSQQGMDEVDARTDYEVVQGYNFKQERREADVSETKRRKLTHNNTKYQLSMISKQLTNYLPKWEARVRELLDQPNHGIPSVTEIERRGRRVQDKKNIAAQMADHDAKSASLTREILTINNVKKEANNSAPSNDKLLKMGEARLKSRERIIQITRKKFWETELEVDGERPTFHVVWKLSIKSFPYLRRWMIHVEQPKNNKSSVLNVVGSYLKFAKRFTKLLCEFCHGNNSMHPNFVSKRDRSFEQVDLLEWMGYVKIVDISDAPTVAVASAVSTCISSFQQVDDHYTYILRGDEVAGSSTDDVSDDVAEEVVDAVDVETNDTEEPSNIDDGNSLRRSSRKRRAYNTHRSYPGEESSSEEESDDEEEIDDDAPVPLL